MNQRERRIAIVFGTSDGVWVLEDGQCKRAALAGKEISHVATCGGTTLAAVPHDGLYDASKFGQRRIWQGDARSCAIAPDGKFYVGTEPAMVYRSDDRGMTWRRLDKIDELPTRKSWYFPPPPHLPHVRSIDFLPDVPGSVLAGVEVGGVLLSDDYGENWREMNAGVNADVHTVRPDPSQPGRVIAVTGGGVYASEDGGAKWEERMTGIDQGYAVGLHINPARSGEVMVATGESPPGLNGRVYHSLNAGRSWKEIQDTALPAQYDRVPVVLFSGGAWVATEEGQVFLADDARSGWSLVCELPAAIDAAVAGASPSSVSGWR